MTPSPEDRSRPPDFGKSRAYRCWCGTLNIRPLNPTGPLIPCPQCFSGLEGMPYEVYDDLILARDILSGRLP